MSLPVRHAIVAGAGIGGLVAALALARAGLRVTVLERLSVLEDVGAGIQLPPNALRVLGQLGLADVLDTRANTPPAVRVRRARDGRDLMCLKSAAMAARWGTAGRVIHRADLQRLLIEAVALEPGITLDMGAAVAGFAAGADGVAVALRRGLIRQQLTGDLLIGADGMRSAVRSKLAGVDDLRFSGHVAWRALIDMGRLPAHSRAPETTLWLAPKAHAVQYPVRGGTLMNVVAVVENAAAGAADDDFWNQPGDPAMLTARFRHGAPALRQLLEAAEGWRVWPLYERASQAPWTQDRVALLGDAAHPMLPFLAQGAAQAIEDAGVLGAALAGNGDTMLALASYEKQRRERAEHVARQSARQGRIYHMAGLAALARDFVMRHSGEARLLRKLDWLYAAT